MSIEDRVKAAAKNVEGKLQEVAGEITGDPKDQIEGKAKQQQASVMHTKENIKDALKDSVDQV